MWLGVVLATTGLALIAGVPGGSSVGDLLVLAGAAVYSLQILLMERFAPRYDPLGFTLLDDARRVRGALGRGDPDRSRCRTAGRCGARCS